MKDSPADSSSIATVQVLSTSISVCSDSPELIKRFSKLCAHFDPGKQPRTGSACTFRTQAGSTTGEHRLFLAGKEILLTNNLSYLLACLEYEVYQEVIRREADHLLMHAGAASLRENGILLAGEKGAGKTTLVAFLVQNGFRYVADEISAIAFGSERLTPVPRTLNVKEPVRERLARAGDSLEVSTYGDDPTNYRSHFALPRPASVRKRPVPISLIVFPQYRLNARTRMLALKKSEAAVELVRHSHNFSWLPGKCFDTVANLAGKVPCFRLAFGDPEEAVEEIRGRILQS